MADKAFLNIFALIGAFAGLANTGLAWILLGTGREADAWMMAIVIIQAFVLLSQLGVEQFAVFSSEAYSRSDIDGVCFDYLSQIWALVFGVVFSTLLYLARTSVITAFASGYDAELAKKLGELIFPLISLVVFAPVLFVLRQKLLLSGRKQMAILLNSGVTFSQTLALSFAYIIKSSNAGVLSQILGGTVAVLSIVAILLFRTRKPSQAFSNVYSLWPFIKSSIQIRATHSVHNFFVALITNSALSGGVNGTVSAYQYVKKIADGLASISVGPHLTVYHADQAITWSAGNRLRFFGNIKEYLLTSIPLLVFVFLAFAIAVEFAARVLAFDKLGFVIEQFPLLFVLVSWQIVVSLETIPAGVLVMEKRAGLVFLVNGLYISILLIAIKFAISKPYTGLDVSLLVLSCQVVSSFFFAAIARSLYFSKFSR